MPCNSVSVAVVQLTEQGAWLLAQMKDRPELKDAILLAIATELRTLLPDDERWDVTPREYAPIITLLSEKFNNVADVSFVAVRPQFNYTAGTAQAFMQRIGDAVGASVNAVAAQLLAEFTKADMLASGFEILEDTVNEAGERVIDWEVAVTA
jgi:hypothetical protein